jgi:hypothetical protein
MSDNKSTMDPEAMLATLDQITKTIEVLAGAVTRLQRHVQANMPKAEVAHTQSDTDGNGKKMLH